MRLARRRVKDEDTAVVAALHAIRNSHYVEVTPLPDHWYEVAVKVEDAHILPNVDGRQVFDPDRGTAA